MADYSGRAVCALLEPPWRLRKTDIDSQLLGLTRLNFKA